MGVTDGVIGLDEDILRDGRFWDLFVEIDVICPGDPFVAGTRLGVSLGIEVEIEEGISFGEADFLFFVALDGDGSTEYFFDLGFYLFTTVGIRGTAE